MADGLEPEHTHVFRLLPVDHDFWHTFGCYWCGGLVNTSWSASMTGRPLDETCKTVIATVSAVLGVECTYAADCPENCGCILGGEDADRRECGCDGPCNTGGANAKAARPGDGEDQA